MGTPLCKTVNVTESSCYRQPLVGASAWGLEAGGELLLTVAAVPTAILEGQGRHEGREAQQVPLVTIKADQGHCHAQRGDVGFPQSQSSSLVQTWVASG